MGLGSLLRDLEGIIITPEQFKADEIEDVGAETLLRIRRPFGCSPIGPLSWMAFQSFDLIIETCEEMIPNRDHIDFGHATMRRLRLELKRDVLRRAGESDNGGSDKEKRRALRAHTRKVFEQLIAPYRRCHWHYWLCPIGPYIAEDETNIPYAVCWADIVYLFHCKNYHERFCDVYWTIIEYMRQGVNILINPDDAWMTYMRYMHVFSSLYIHIQVLEKYNARIGGNWDDVIDRMRTVQKVLHREWEMDTVEIGMLAEQFSVENIRELTHCGRGLNQLLNKRTRSLL